MPRQTRARSLPAATDVSEAERVLAGLVVRTPLLPCVALSERAGVEVLIKPELFQSGGSFKVRGVLNRIRAMPDADRQCGVATVSAGNDGVAVANVCAKLGVKATIFMPSNASAAKVTLARAAGATVDTASPDAAAAFVRLAEYVERTGATVVHPYDDPDVIAGAGTVGAEIARDRPDTARVVVPVGGGGLISGVAVALAHAAPQAEVVAVEPARAATLTAALDAGRPTPVDHVPTLADSLAPPILGDLAFAICADHVRSVITLDEDELREGLRAAYSECKLACEVGGAAAIAALATGKVEVDEGPVVVVASGGNVAPEVLRQLL
jgi:threonine dehydratase